MAVARDTLTPNQLKAIEMMVGQGLSAKEVGSQLKISSKTVSKWKQQPLFAETLAEAQQMVEEAVWDKLAAGANEAVATLLAVMRDTKEKGAVRIQAANSVLDRGGFKERKRDGDGAEPFSSREDMLAALAQMPRDLLEEALGRAPDGGDE